MESLYLKRLLIVGLSLVVVLLSLKLIYPFIIPILGALVTVLAFYPVRSYLCKKIKNKNIVSVILVLFIILVIGLPMIWLIPAFVKEINIVFLIIKQHLYSGDLFPRACVKSTFCDFSQQMNQFLSEPNTKVFIQDVGLKIQNALYNYGSNLIFEIPRKIADIFVFVFISFYLFRDGDKAVDLVKKVLPLSSKHQGHLFEKTNGTIYGILYGTFLVAILQGVLSAVAFYFLGFSSPIFWAFLIFVMSILPGGTGLIWIPMAIYLFYNGISLDSTAFMWKGVILSVFGLAILTVMEHIWKPMIIGSRVHMNPALVLLGVLGGLIWFGIVGFFVGPIILALLIAVTDIYIEMCHKDGKKVSAKSL